MPCVVEVKFLGEWAVLSYCPSLPEAESCADYMRGRMDWPIRVRSAVGMYCDEECAEAYHS